MSIPIRAPLWISSASCEHLLSEEIDQQEWRVALGAGTAQANGPRKELAFGATTLADGAFTADGAFVHGPRHDYSAALELVPKLLQVGCRLLVTQAESELLVGARAIPCAA
jgi:hypothetical protein